MISGKHYKKLTLPGGKKRDEHRVIMENKLGRTLGFNEIVHHRDEVKTNNSEGNLEIISRAEHGRLHAKTRVYGPEYAERMRAIGIATMTNRKLSETQVLEIRALHGLGSNVKDIQNAYDISRRTVYDIITKVTWKHI